MSDGDSLSVAAFRARWLTVFVPEGLNDRSQAIYCLECVQKGDPSRRDGMSRASRCVHRPRNVRRFVLLPSLAAVKAQKNTAPRIRWIRRAAVPPRTIRKNLRRYTGSGLRVFQMICLSIVPIGLAAFCKI